ncbi:YkgJ family cysteine cluster protein [Bdellovibrionota bacterium FG-1]
MHSKKWWSEGIRFECQGSGRCCLFRGQYGFVYLTLEDRRRFALFFKIPTHRFTAIYCEKTSGYYHLKMDPNAEECRFLKKNSCSIYEARPTQCRTWPFWPAVMGAKSWVSEVENFCPGVGKGKLISAVEISKVLEQQRESESKM